MITFSVSRSPNYLNTLVISSVVCVGSIASKGWQKFETVHLGRAVVRAGFDPQHIFLEWIALLIQVLPQMQITVLVFQSLHKTYNLIFLLLFSKEVDKEQTWNRPISFKKTRACQATIWTRNELQKPFL